MPIIRSQGDGFKLVDWTQEINNIDNQFGLINGMNLFSTTGTSQTAIVFDKNDQETTLLPQVSRRAGHTTKGVDRKVETFSLPLAYFKHSDYITVEDIQGWRQPGSPEAAETFARVRAQKLQDMRAQVDQSVEYMKLQAVKGVMKTPDGSVIADMFSEFSITQKEIDFELGTATTDIDAKISELKRYLASNLRTGATVNGKPLLIVDTQFFDKLVSHPNMRQAYLYYQNNGSQRLRDATNQMMAWGSVDQFEHRGVIFMTYDAVFKLPDGTAEAAIEANTGHLVPNVNGLFRGYYGPSNKLSGANSVGRDMFAYEYSDPRDEQHEMQVETAPLFFATQPQVLVKVITSN